MTEHNLIAYAVILAAKDGDPDAMEQILNHYELLIERHSWRLVSDGYGGRRKMMDEGIKERIRAKVMRQIIGKFDPHILPEGETLED